MADNRIRIILEGVDRFSKTLKGANKSIDEFSRLGTKRFKDFNSDVEDTRQTLAELANDVDKHNQAMARQRNALIGLGSSYRALKNEIRGVINEQRKGVAAFGGGTSSRGPGGRFQRAPEPEPSNARRLARGFAGGLAEARETRNTIIAAASQNKKDIELRRQALADNLRATQIGIKREIELKKIATKQEMAIREAELNKEINTLKKAAPEGFERLIANKQADFRSDRATRLLDIEHEGSLRQSAAIAENAVNRRNLTRPDIAQITKDVLAQRKAVSEVENGFERLGRRAGLALGDIGRGFDQGKRGIIDLTGAGRLAENAFSKIGLAAGTLVRNFNNLVNLRWFLLISALQIVGTLVVQLGAALVSIASSAVLAGAALGGAFAAGLTQAAVAGGLLKAALSRLQAVVDAGKIADQLKDQNAVPNSQAAKQQRTAIEQLADAHYALKQAIQGVADAEYSHKQAQLSLIDAEKSRVAAIKNLTEARKSAARGIVDADFAQRDAALALKDAEFAVIDAKKKLFDIERQQLLQQSDIDAAQRQVKNAQTRLAQVRQQGDQEQVLAAEQQLAAAQNAVSSLQDQQQVSKTDVQEAQLGIQKAQLQRKEAIVTSKRAREDNAKAQREGVKGNDQVISAQKQLADSIKSIADAQHQLAETERQRADALHGVTIAQRGLKDAQTDKVTPDAKSQQLKVALAGLSPAEKELFKSIQRIKALYKKQFRPITDIIINSFTRAIDTVSGLLKDPKILKAFRTLATEIGKGVDKISKFAVSPTFKKEFERFIDQASKNLPKVVDIFINLLKIFLKISTAGEGIFGGLLTGLDKLTKKGVEKTKRQQGPDTQASVRGLVDNRKKSPVENLLELGSKHLNSWIKLAEAIAKVVTAIIKGSQSTGLDFVESITGALNDFADFLNTHPAEVQKFFDDLEQSLKDLAPLIEETFVVLFKAFTSPEGSAFTELILKTVIPGLALMFQTTGLVSKVLLALFDIPFIGPFFIFASQVVVAEKALNKVFPATQHVTNGLKKMLKFVAKDIPSGFQATRLALAKFTTSVSLAFTAAGKTATKGADKFKKIGTSIGESLAGGAKKGTSSLKTFATNAVGIVTGMTKKIVAQFAKLNFASIASSFGTALVNMGKSVLVFSKAVALAFITPPLSIVLLIGAVIAAIILLDQKFHFLMPTLRLIEKVGKAAFRGIVDGAKLVFDWVKNHWKTLAAILISIFLPGGIILVAIIKWHDKIIGIAKTVAKEVYGWFKTLSGWIIDIYVKLPAKIIKVFFNLGKRIVNPIVGFFEKMPERILNALRDLPDKIVHLFDGVGKKIGDKLLGFLPKKARNGILAGLGAAIPGGSVVQGIASVIHRKTGGITPGHGSGDTVPAMLTPGEWVLNKIQQSKIAQRLKTNVGDLSRFLFGSNTTTAPGPHTTRTKPTGETPLVTPFFTLHPQQDDDGNTVWFLEFGDRTWGQVSSRAANRIIKSDGNWFPGYARRAAKQHRGFFHDPRASLLSSVANSGLLSDAHDRRFALGGMVPNVQKFAQGGPVLNAPGGSASHATTKNINLSMQPIVQGDSDWHYVMRVAALHAEGSF